MDPPLTMHTPVEAGNLTLSSLNSSSSKSGHSALNTSAINLSIDESGDEGGKTSDLLSAAAGIADVSRPPRIPGPNYNRNTLVSASSGKQQLDYGQELDDNDEKFGLKVMKNESSEQRSTLGQMAQQVKANARTFNRFSGRQNTAERFDYGNMDEIVDGDDDEDGADVDLCIPGNEHTGRWTRKEHELFLDALKKHGKEWKKVASAVKTRTVVQTRTHAQKYFQKVTKTGGGGGYSDDDGFEGAGSAARGSSSIRRASKRTRRSHSGDGRRNNGGGNSYQRQAEIVEDDYDKDEAMDVINPNFAITPVMPKAKSAMSAMNMSMSSLPEDFPQPSPAACGKRKEAELTAAKMLAASSASQDMEGANVLSTLKGAAFRPGEIVRRQRVNLPMLSIINPESISNGDTPVESATPGTPWEKEIRELEAKEKKHHPIAVATPSQQKDFLSKVRTYVNDANVTDLNSILRAAEDSESTMFGGASIPLKDISEDDEKGGEKLDGQISLESFLKSPKAGNESEKEAENVKTEHVEKAASSSSSSGGGASPSTSVIARTLNKLGPNETTVLFDACCLDTDKFNQNIILEVCRTLMEHGASPTIQSGKGTTCLHLAAERGLERVGRLLLNRGCPVNAIRADGNSASHIAVMAGHGQFIELLADFGANCHLRNAQSRSALDLAGASPETTQVREELRRIMLSVEPRLRTLVLYHEDCLEHTARKVDDWEGPDRLMGIMHRLQNREEFPEHELEISSHFDKAPVELLSRVHSREYIAFVDKLSKQLKAEAGDESKGNKNGIVPFTPQVQSNVLNQTFEELKKSEFCDTSFSMGTLQAARRAAGAVAYAVDRVLLGRNRNAFCCVRPPGHHAGYNGLLEGAKSCGFCIFNNVAAGALHALEGHNCERVAIIDLDIHHGNGTEDIVRRYPNPSRLLLFSLHLYDKDLAPDYEFFPGTGATDDSAHNIINVPILPMWHNPANNQQSQSTEKSAAQADLKKEGDLSQSQSQSQSQTTESNTPTSTQSASSTSSPSASGGLAPLMGREAYRQAIIQRLLPSLRAFNPALILLSTGFDPASGDVGNTRSGQTGTDAGMDMQPEDFEWVTSEILKIADICCAGRVVSVLEGGYGSYTEGSPAAQQDQKAASTRSTRSIRSVEEQKPSLDRHVLASAASSHVHRLVDTYGEAKQHPLLSGPPPLPDTDSNDEQSIN